MGNNLWPRPPAKGSIHGQDRNHLIEGRILMNVLIKSLSVWVTSLVAAADQQRSSVG